MTSRPAAYDAFGETGAIFRSLHEEPAVFWEGVAENSKRIARKLYSRLAQIAGQLYRPNRDFQSKCLGQVVSHRPAVAPPPGSGHARELQGGDEDVHRGG